MGGMGRTTGFTNGHNGRVERDLTRVIEPVVLYVHNNQDVGHGRVEVRE